MINTIDGYVIFKNIDITGLSLEKTLEKLATTISTFSNIRLISIIFSEDSTESEIIEATEKESE